MPVASLAVCYTQLKPGRRRRGKEEGTQSKKGKEREEGIGEKGSEREEKEKAETSEGERRRGGLRKQCRLLPYGGGNSSTYRIYHTEKRGRRICII